MNLPKPQKSSKFNKLIQLKIRLTGFLFLGVLSFCLSQSSSIFSDKLLELGTTESEYREAEYYTSLRELQLNYQVHIDTNCNDKALLYKNLGNHFYCIKDRVTALRFYQDTALQIALSCPTIDNQLITQIYLNLIDTKIVLDQMSAIPPLVDQLIWHLDQNKAGPIAHQAKIQSAIARYFEEIGDYDQSILWIRNSIANHNKIPLNDKKLDAYLTWAYTLYSTADYLNAIAIFDSTRNLAKELGLQDDEYYNEDLIYNKAVCYEELGEFAEALFYIEKYAEMTDVKNEITQSYITNLKAYVSSANKKYSQALHHMDLSIQLYLKSEDDYEYLRLFKDYLFNSNAHLQLKNYQKSAEAALQAVERSIVPKANWQDSVFDFSNLFVKNPNEFNKAALSFFKAIVHFESEEKIISFADQLDSTFFSLQTYYAGDESKAEITTRHHDFCDQLLSYLFNNQLEKKYPNLTAYYISTSKSLALFEKLSIKEGIPTELQPEYDALNKEWNEIYSALEVQETLGDRAKIDSLAQVNFQLNLRKDKLDKKLAALNLIPNFRSLKASLIEEAKSNLKEGEAIVDFFYGKEQIYSWSTAANRIHFTTDRIHSFLQQDFIPTFSSTAGQYLEVYDEKVDSLSNYFTPFFNLLDNKTTKITLIPDGRLLYFPFEVLQLKNKSLLEQANIHYLFSYSIKDFIKSQEQNPSEAYGGFAMQYDAQLLQAISSSEKIYELYKDSFNLSELPYALTEVQLTQAIFGGQAFLDDACTRASFFAEAPNYQILHIANHALLNEQNSLLSSFIFTKNDEADLINLIDLKKLTLNADLAILSSCNSGRGENIEGSGLRSLGLSFAEAGCPAILVNLWEAADKSTKQIIEGFAGYLKEGMYKSAALQKAKLDYIQSAPGELRHPKYWANIVLIGDDSPIEFKQAANSNWLFYLLFIIALIVGGTLLRKKLVQA